MSGENHLGTRTHASIVAWGDLIVVTFSLLCEERSRYCIQYSNGTLHDVLTFELIVVIAGGFAIFGYLRASALFKAEQDAPHTSVDEGREGEEPMFLSGASLSGPTEDGDYFLERRDPQQ